MTSVLVRPLRLDARGQFARVTGGDAIGARVTELLGTLPREVEMAPDLGSGLRLRRYEPGDATLAAELRADTADALAAWEPSLAVDGFTATSADNATDVDVTVRVRSRLTGEEGEGEASVDAG